LYCHWPNTTGNSQLKQAMTAFIDRKSGDSDISDARQVVSPLR
jgi:hypothetical protein